MAAFFEDLWTSIFTPGPTSTLLIATNVTFAALQSILLALLIATYSVHFVVLSILSAGLWGAINWFAKEVIIAQAQQEESERVSGGGHNAAGAEITLDESSVSGSAEVLTRKTHSGQRSEGASGQYDTSGISTSQETWNTSAAARLAPKEGDTFHHRRNLSESVGDLNTDSEWEKVEDER